MTELTDYVARRHQMTMVIVFAFLLSVVVYFLVAFLVSQMGSASLESVAASQKLRRVAYGFTLIYGIGVVVFRRAMLRTNRLEGIVMRRGLRGLVDYLATMTVAVVALSEVVAVLGLILSLLLRTVEDMIRLGGVAAMLILYSVPRRSKWFHLVEAYQTTTGVTE